ncbi:MAG: putative signaling protein [Herminiimonas sp.]|nr:putative signaling protein [Herminiimonas sp.]
MTLIRQLAIIIVTLFVLLFAGTIAISVNDTRAYLNLQLKTISQDTATSLGLSLSPTMAARDIAVVESMVNAVFDSGYYREVAIRSIEGKPILERQAPVRIEGVPAWFVRLVPLETPRGEALIMSGWQQAGTVSVAANPGQAYMTLWSHSVNAFWWFFAALIVTAMLGVLALHVVLRPLRMVEAQAAAICDREYPVQTKLPWAVELRSVVVAMNRMTTKIKEMFDAQTAAIERLRSDSYRDGLTGLANRRYFDMHMKQVIESAQDAPAISLMFIELKDFKAFNERMGYEAGDDLLRAAADTIDQVCKAQTGLEYHAARFAGANFGVVLAGATEHDARELGERLARALAGLHERGLTDTEEVCHIGIAVHGGHSVSELLSDADMALRAAQVSGPNAVDMRVQNLSRNAATFSASHWSELLGTVIRDRQIIVQMQPVLDTRDRHTVLQHDALLRIVGEDGALITAGVFIPMAKRLGLIREFDKLVVTEVMKQITAGRCGKSLVAVNLVPSSMQDATFADWLCDALRANPAAAAQIAFEVSEYGALENVEALRTTVLRIRALGGKFGIDHFGRGFTSYGYLSTLKIDYLKIDGSYVRGIAENRDNQFLVESITKIAHGLDLKVIAETVEADEEWAMLQSLRVDGVQGYGVGMPKGL